MAYTTASQLASYILFKAGERGIRVSNLKLQKLLYYCQAWHLAITGEPLFGDRIEAWVHGPVVPRVFGIYKEHRWSEIPIPPSAEIEAGSLGLPIAEHVSDVIDVYASMSGPELERLTHQESPWIDARGGIPAHEPSTAAISTDAMRDYYRSL